MAVTGRRRFFGLFAAACLPVRAGQSEDVRAQLTYTTSALASGNPTDALTCFDKNMPGYDKLSEYFGALTTSFEIVTEIEIASEEDTPAESTLKVSWTLELTDRVNNATKRRTTDVTIHFKPIRGKWKIVSFSPVAMFDPQV